MTETRIIGRVRHVIVEKTKAEDYIYPMPTVDEVVKAGYPKEYWDKVKQERDEFISRFSSDETFRVKTVSDYACTCDMKKYPPSDLPRKNLSCLCAVYVRDIQHFSPWCPQTDA